MRHKKMLSSKYYISGVLVQIEVACIGGHRNVPVIYLMVP